MFKVLLVDDDARNIRILEETLEDGFITSSAGNGEQALKKLPAFAPDVVLLDIMMPGIDGLEVCKRIREEPKYRHVKIILVSGKAMFDERLAGFAAGADDYLTKPFDHTDLLAKVRVYASLKRAVELNERKAWLLEALAVEIQSPLARILAGAADLCDPAGPRGLSWEAATRTVQSCFDKIPAVSRLQIVDVGSLPVCNLHCCAQAASEALEAFAAAQGAVVELAPAAAVEARGDPWLLQQAIMGVLEDAFERSVTGGAINIRVESGHGCAWVRISAIEHHPTVVSQEHHAEVTREAGFRLSLARTIIELHGGNLLLDRSIEGQLAVSLLFPSAKKPGDLPGT